MASLFITSIAMSPIFYNKFKTISLTNNFIKTGYDKNKGIKLHKGRILSDNYVPSLTCNNNAIIRNLKLTEIKYKKTFDVSPVITSKGTGVAINDTIEKVEGRDETFIAYSNPIKLKLSDNNDDNDYDNKILTQMNINDIMYDNYSSGELSIGQIEKLKAFTNVNEFKAGEILYKEWTIVNNSFVYCIEKLNNSCPYDICDTNDMIKLRKYIGNKYYDEWEFGLICFAFVMVWIIVLFCMWLLNQ